MIPIESSYHLVYELPLVMACDTLFAVKRAKKLMGLVGLIMGLVKLIMGLVGLIMGLVGLNCRNNKFLRQ